jgi:chondroitin AC lyase
VNRFYFFIIGALLSLVSCKEGISLRYEEGYIRIDGTIDEPAWSAHRLFRGMVSPWVQDRTDCTEFYACIHNRKFCFAFSVVDTTLTVHAYAGEKSVETEDRVELFFDRSGGRMEHYYCIEIDPAGRILDYEAKYYRDFTPQWNFQTLKIMASRNQVGYMVEGLIDLDELGRLGLGNPFRLGVFRADFDSTGSVVWFTYADPHSSVPDFHIPASLVSCRY